LGAGTPKIRSRNRVFFSTSRIRGQKAAKSPATRIAKPTQKTAALDPPRFFEEFRARLFPDPSRIATPP
jgi:hypothetical protein